MKPHVSKLWAVEADYGGEEGWAPMGVFNWSPNTTVYQRLYIALFSTRSDAVAGSKSLNWPPRRRVVRVVVTVRKAGR